MDRRELGLVALALAIALGTLLPTLAGGFYTDDFVLLAGLERPHEATAEAPFRLYRLAGGPRLPEVRSRGPLPWWTSDTFRAEPARPLTSALFTIDHALAGRRAWAYHAHSLLWLGLFVALGARALARRLEGRAAWLGVALFALAPSQVFAAGWISARHALVSAVFALLAIELVPVSGQRARAAELGLLVLALLAGESGVGAVLAVIALHLVEERAPIARVVPHALALGAYLAVYRALDLGFHGSGEYVDPGEPLALLVTLPQRLLALAGAGIVAAPTDLWLISREVQRGLALAGALALGLAGTALALRGVSPGLRRALVRLACLSLALLPGSLGQLGDRVLLLPSLAIAEVIALAALSPSARPAAGHALAAVHALALVVVRAQLVVGLVSASAASATLARAPAFHGVDGESDVVVLAAADPLAGVFDAVARRVLVDHPPRSHHVLSMAPATHRFVAVDAHTLEWTVEARIGASPRERVFRAAPVEPGERARTASFVLEVREVGASRSRGVVRFERTLDDPGLVLVAWTAEGLVRLDVRSLRRGVTLPHVPGPQGI